MRASPRVVLATAAAAQSAVSLLGFGLPAIGPELRQEFSLSLTGLGAVLTASLLGSGICLIGAGVAVDRFGSRPVTLVGTVVGTGGLIGAAFAGGVPLLLAMLFLSGVGSSAIPIAGVSALFRAFPASRRAWALGVRQMAVPVGGITAAIVLPPLAHAGGARAVFLFAAGMLGLFGTMFALLGGDAPAELGSRPKAELARVLRMPGMGRLLLCAGFLVVVLNAVLVYTVPAARDSGLTRFAAGAIFFAIQITAGVARIVWGRLADRDGGRRRVRTLVEAGWVAAAGGVLFALALHAGAAAVMAAAIFFAFGALGWNALVYVIAGEAAPHGLAAQAVSIVATLVFVLAAVSTPIMGTLAARGGWDAFWIVTAAFAACAALVAGTLRAPRPVAAPGRGS